MQWYLAPYYKQNKGEILTVFIGTGCLNVLIIYNDDGSKALQPYGPADINNE